MKAGWTTRARALRGGRRWTGGTAAYAVFTLLLLGHGFPAHAQADFERTGVEVGQDPNGNSGITSHDIFTLLDARLGSNFQSLTIVFGGCYGQAFTDVAKNAEVSGHLQSGNVAIIAATGDSTTCQLSPTTNNGSPLIQGILENFVPPSTIAQAFDHGVTSIQNFEKDSFNKRTDKGHQDENFQLTTPVATYFPVTAPTGQNITLAGNKENQHAILFVGYPSENVLGDWKDVHDQFQMLVDAGWDPSQIAVYWFRGQAAGGSPSTPGGTSMTERAGVNAGAFDMHYSLPNGGGGPILIKNAATFDLLKEKLTNWGAFEKAENGKTQFYLYFGGHDTLTASARSGLLSQAPGANQNSLGGLFGQVVVGVAIGGHHEDHGDRPEDSNRGKTSSNGDSPATKPAPPQATSPN